MRRLVATLLLLFTPPCWPELAVANHNCGDSEAAKLVSLQGKLYVDADNNGNWRAAQLNQQICEGGRVRLDIGRASLLLPDGIILRLNEGTVLSLNGIALNKPTLLDLLKGFVHFLSRTPRHLQINTPIANAGPEGTEFALSVDDAQASLWVYEGAVKLSNSYGEIRLNPGEGAQAQAGQAPQTYIGIKPMDAVNWALYYPPLLPYPEFPQHIDSDIFRAITDFRQGRVDLALTRLDGLSPERQTPYFLKIRAAIRLTVGRVAFASQDIQTLLANNPNDAEALALRSVLALTQNHKEDAYDFARNAISANPNSATAYSALSYAEQSRFNLEQALAAANQAVRLAPYDAMLWARQAELELALGLVQASKESAQHAVKLDAFLERTQTVTGFAHLLRMDTEAALQAFEKAVNYDSTSALARFGYGLAKIRMGDLGQGREDLEIAAILDPGNSLIRSYLGKAYYEENRNKLAEDQFSLAKQRDLKDPTPYFYDAIKKQAENRPIEALKDLQQAMALNDNRAVYRSKQLLDADRASRGASLARIYDNLGFEQRGLVEAGSSLQIAPSNYSAHRFLSDTYVNQHGRETAQLSELLQAKMLQPININPVQPHLSVSQRGLLSTSGIANSSFQDFTRSFERNRPQLLVSGIAGSQDSLGDEVTVSGIYNKFSYSLGQYHYGTDGIDTGQFGAEPKKHNESHNIYDAFLQAGITDYLDMQFEYLNRGTSLGNTNQNTKGTLQEEMARVGVHLKPSPSQHWLGLYTNKDFNIGQSARRTTKTTGQTDLWEGQFIGLHDAFKLTSGFSFYESKLLFNLLSKPKNQNGFNVYAYPYFHLFNQVNILLGLTYDQHDPDSGENGQNDKWNPKIGLQWDISAHAKLRMAYLTGYKRPLTVSETLEPTHVVGFNQLFDELNGRSFGFYGVATDFSWPSFFSGVEINRKEIFSFDQDNQEVPERYTNAFKTYVSLTALDNFAINAEYRYEKSFFYVEDRSTIYTHKIPIQLKYFSPLGLYGNIGATWVFQKDFESNLETNSEFVVIDAGVGYRLPKRLGIVSVELRNVLDERFQYNDFSTIDQANIFNTTLEFFPERTLFSRVTLNF